MKTMPLPDNTYQKPSLGITGVVNKIPVPGKRDDSMIPVDDPSLTNVNPSEIATGTVVVHVPLDLIDPSPYQPRLDFNDEKIAELADSIQSSSQITPIIVRKLPTGRYELVGGERRVRALRTLKRKTAEAVIRYLSDTDAAILAIVDNEARENLSDYERGKGYKKLLDEGRVKTQTELSAKVGRSNATIARMLSYFNLPPQVLSMLDERPSLIGNKVVSDFARLTKQGHGDIVIKYAERISKGHCSQEVALNFAQSEVDRLLGRKLQKDLPKSLMASGRQIAEFRFEGKRNLMIKCNKDIDPQILMKKIESMLAEDPDIFSQ